MGHGTVINKSLKQKLNGKSSTETEVIGMSDVLPFNIWLNNFVVAQGNEFKEKILFQDNQSVTRIENNGIKSCTGNSKHIRIRHLLVKDGVDKGEVSIKYCPTEWMLADYFTKPLQG